MKSKYFGILTFFAFGVILIFSCKKNSVAPLEQSVWIESIDKKDTIIFRGEGSLILNRPRVLQNGYVLPKMGAGPYDFKELKDSIGLRYSLSSLSKFFNYSFKIEGNTLYIDDFYDKSGKLLVYKRFN